MLLRTKGQKGSVSMFPPPMNRNGVQHSGVQPVQYNDVTLACQVAGVQQGTHLSRALVHWRTGHVELYYGTERLFDGVFRTLVERRYCDMFYLREVVEFLCRGHSLLDSECRCLHKRDAQRAAELGISRNKYHHYGGDYDPDSWRDGQCALPSTRIARTAQEIAQEVALTDIESLLPRIQSSPHVVTLQGEKECLYAFKATFDTVNCKEELLHLVFAHPLGIREPLARETYNTAPADMQALADEQRIYRFYNAEIKAHMCFPRAPQYEMNVDEDIKRLWHDVGGDGSSSVEQALLQAGLTPMRHHQEPHHHDIKKRKRKRSRDKLAQS